MIPLLLPTKASSSRSGLSSGGALEEDVGLLGNFQGAWGQQPLGQEVVAAGTVP